jgi:hypothetical protein
LRPAWHVGLTSSRDFARQRSSFALALRAGEILPLAKPKESLHLVRPKRVGHKRRPQCRAHIAIANRNRLLYRRFPQIGSVGCRLYHDPSGRRTKSLADLVVCAAPMEEQPRLIAHIVEQLGRFVTEKRASGVGAQLQ